MAVLASKNKLCHSPKYHVEEGLDLYSENTQAHTYTHTHTHMHADMHALTHTYTHTHTPLLCSPYPIWDVGQDPASVAPVQGDHVHTHYSRSEPSIAVCQ